MSRRDLIIYFLIALFGLGGGALVSGLTVQAGAVTPYLIWGGFSAMLLAGIGLCLMLFTAPVTTAQGAQTALRQPLSDNAAALLGYLLGAFVFLAFVTLFGMFLLNIRPQEAARARVLPPAFRGPVTSSALRDPKFLASDPTHFIGQPESASGTVVSDDAERNGQRYTVTLTTPAMVPQAYLVFDDSGPSDYSEGDHIYASCRIERADAQALGLTGCKVISPQDWASGKSAP